MQWTPDTSEPSEGTKRCQSPEARTPGDRPTGESCAQGPTAADPTPGRPEEPHERDTVCTRRYSCSSGWIVRTATPQGMPA
eukprot:14485720-Alexandrium_andersonii.AAC.1